MRSLLNSFSDFIIDYMDEDFPDFKNIVNKAVQKVPKILVRKKTIIMPEQVYKLRDDLINIEKLQQATYLMLLAASGARISESLRITTDMIDENNTAFDGLFLETAEELKTKGHGKNGLMMTRFIITDVFLPIYKKWLPEREKIMRENNQNHNFIFISKDGSPAKVSTVNSWIESWEKLAGLNLYAHCFRHFIVSDLTRKGCSSDFIIAVMKWKSGGVMFNIYNDIEDKDRKWKEVDKLKDVFKINSTTSTDL